MNFVPLIVIVVFLIIWIVSNVLRAQQEDARGYKRNVNPRANIGESKPLQQNSGNDIDRFLQEIERLRKKNATSETAANPTQSSASSSRSTSTITAPRPAAKPKPLPQPKKAKQPVPRRVDPPAAPKPTPSPKPFETPASPPPMVTPASYEITPVQATPTVPVMDGISQAILGKGAGDKAFQKDFLDSIQVLFKTASGSKMAVVMHEIFGPPKSSKQ